MLPQWSPTAGVCGTLPTSLAPEGTRSEPEPRPAREAWAGEVPHPKVDTLHRAVVVVVVSDIALRMMRFTRTETVTPRSVFLLSIVPEDTRTSKKPSSPPKSSAHHSPRTSARQSAVGRVDNARPRTTVSQSNSRNGNLACQGETATTPCSLSCTSPK